MKYFLSSGTLLIFFIILTFNVCCAIIVNDYYNNNGQDLATQNNNYDYNDSYEDYEDEFGKRRHKKRRKPCPTNKVAPSGKTFINIHYTDVTYSESSHNYHGGGGGLVGHDSYPGNGYPCGSGIGNPENNQIFPLKPQRPHRPLINGNRPGLFQNNGNRPGLLNFLNDLLFGESKPADNSGSFTPSSVSVEEETPDLGSSTGPLGGTVPDKLKVSPYNQFNIRRAYREFNRELDSFLRPFYRLF